MKKIILNLLSKLAKSVIDKHKPMIIWITWSIGKTTTTRFVSDFLKNIYWNEVYYSLNYYNWEFWIPLTILLTRDSPWKNLIGWAKVLFKWFLLILKKDYPKYLVLEYGIDTPWEMDFLLNIAKPNYGIILNIFPSNIERFWNFESYKQEKLKFVKASKNIIFNLDNLEELKDLGKNMMYYGKNEDSSIYATDIKTELEKISFTLNYREEKVHLEYNMLGDHQVYNIMPVFALWIFLGIELETIKDALSWVSLPKWRWNILTWISEAIIIDWSYNWWFEAMKAWIAYLEAIEEDFYKMLFLGDMRELWQETEATHLELAHIIKQSTVNFIFLVWEEMKKYVYENLKDDFENRIFRFQTSVQAGKNIRELLININDKRSIIFVKWSQNTIFLEEWIKEFLYDMRDQEQLCRQNLEWMAKKEYFYSNIIV